MLEPSIPPGDAPCPHCGSLVWFPRASGVNWTAGFPVYSLAPAEARTKEQAIRAVVGRLVKAAHVAADDREALVSAILKRESLGSTGIGRGLAIPHACHPSAKGIIGALAKIPCGVAFDAVDEQPVYLLCLLIAPVERPGDYLRALEATSRSLRGLP